MNLPNHEENCKLRLDTSSFGMYHAVTSQNERLSKGRRKLKAAGGDPGRKVYVHYPAVDCARRSSPDAMNGARARSTMPRARSSAAR